MTQTDARTAALRRAVVDACAHYVSEGYSGLDREYIQHVTPRLYAALDALTQQHEAVGAVKALEAVPCQYTDPYPQRGEKDTGGFYSMAYHAAPLRRICFDHRVLWDTQGYNYPCHGCRELAAWRKRLAGEEP